MSSDSERSTYLDAPMYLSHSSDEDDKHDADARRLSTPVHQQGVHSTEVTGKAPDDQIGARANETSGRRNTKSQRNKLSRTYGSPKMTSPRRAQRASNDRADGAATETNDPVRPEQIRSLPVSTGNRDRGDEPLNKSKSDDVGRKASVRTTRTTASAFMNGSTLAGPNAEPSIDKSIYQRGTSAERTLSKKEKEKIYKEESESSWQNPACRPTDILASA